MKNWYNIQNRKGNEIDIDIDGEIGGDGWESGVTADQVKANLKAMANALAGPVSRINVNILNSPGGDLSHAFAIYDMLTQHQAPVTTRGIGMVASAATVIFQAGDKGERLLAPNAIFLVHRAWGITIGNADQMDAMADGLRTWEKRIVAIYKEGTSRSEEQIHNDMNFNNGDGEWWDAERTIANGYADGEMQSNRIAASTIKPELFAKHKLPKLPNQSFINKSNTEMKKFLMKNLPSLAAFLGLKVEDEVEITEEHLNKVNGELQSRADQITAVTAERDTALANASNEAALRTKAESDLAAANARIKNLEDELSRLKGDKTKTEDREDPNLSEAVTGGNLAAANKDAETFKS